MTYTCLQVKKSLEWLQEPRVENHRFAAVLILKACNFTCSALSFFPGSAWLAHLVIFLCDVADVAVILSRTTLNTNYLVIAFSWCGERTGCWREMILFCGGIL